jgi:hypothetical protein
MIQELLSQVPSASHAGPVSGMPKDCAKVRLAPFEPVWSQLDSVSYTLHLRQFMLERRDSPLDGCCDGVEDDGVV